MLVILLTGALHVLAKKPNRVLYSLSATPPKDTITIVSLQDPVLVTDSPSCTIPFTKIGKLILIKGKADNTEGSFFLDTGSPYLVFNSTYFRNLPLLDNSDEIQGDINSEHELTRKAVLPQVELGSFGNLVSDGNGNVSSFIVIAPNYTFRLKGFTKARNVTLAGEFNNWSPKGLAMVKEHDGWSCRVYLRRGKHLYKFVVDGKWMRDPATCGSSRARKR